MVQLADTEAGVGTQQRWGGAPAATPWARPDVGQVSPKPTSLLVGVQIRLCLEPASYAQDEFPLERAVLLVLLQ